MNTKLKGLTIEELKTLSNEEVSSVRDINNLALIVAMSEDSEEKSTDTFTRVCNFTGTGYDSVRKYWYDLKKLLPSEFSKYPFLTDEEKDVLLYKINKRSKRITWDEEYCNNVLRLIAKFYDPKVSKTYIFKQVASYLGRTDTSIKTLWMKHLKHAFNDADITEVEKKIIAEFNSDITNNVNPEDIASPEFLKRFNVKTSYSFEDRTPENPVNKYEESEYIFRKISDDEYEILKGVAIINKEFVKAIISKNKTVVLDEENKMVAKNYL